ncbi:J domain-containing protein [Polymorphobacter sp. PAMC 29334]|uniref:J domain-containing protein n=1 Tax=Polymorphobacter sp. PAMC 29334 TaxID=2862331 RepID=UPI001C66504E|nr:J domain-containing protein [Polymorphobacter sp. PAMC 29334]QYE36041.1 J domain-containing protein [Polymorphobacter sp. PAMC 29334]
MAGPSRNMDWGFPRWRDYGGTGNAAVTVRICDRDGCNEPGDRPAPKAPNRPERWYFCETHAGEYNRNWNYFEGLSAADARAREADESAETTFTQAKHWGWGGAGDGSRSRAELDALTALELGSDADFAAVKAAYRRLAKANHPDVAPNDAAAARRFQATQAAYEVLERAEERRATTYSPV